MTWIQTASGRKFDLEAPSCEMVDIDDIAQALSRIPRCLGHTVCFFSVAQHSVIVSEQFEGEVAKYALLHDAAEAYIGDIVAPLKWIFRDALRNISALGESYGAPEVAAYADDLLKIEKKILAQILIHFDLDPEKMPGEVKDADLRMLATEKRDLMKPATLLWDGVWNNGIGAPYSHFELRPYPPAPNNDYFRKIHVCENPEAARDEFMDCFKKLWHS